MAGQLQKVGILVGASIFLEFDNFDDLLAEAKKRVQSCNNPPDPFPASADERRLLLANIEEVLRTFERLLCDVLMAISLDQDALQSEYILFTMPAEVDYSPFLALPNQNFGRHCTPDERRQLIDTVCRLWDAHKDSVRYYATYPTVMPFVRQEMMKPESIAKLPEGARDVIELIVSVPEKERSFLWKFVDIFAMRHRRLDDRRIELGILRDVFRGIDGIADRLRALLNNGVAVDRNPDSIVHDDGPVPPKQFRYGGVPHEISRSKVWRLIHTLWTAPNWTMEFDKLGEPVWGDREQIVDQSTLGSLRRDANKFFNAKIIPLEISTGNRYCTMKHKVAPCSLPARAVLAPRSRPARASRPPGKTKKS